MTEKVKVALIGVGNNTSALVQGVAFYRATGSDVGIRRPDIAGLGIADVEFASAFAISDDRIGRDLHDAIFLPPNNYPRLVERLQPSGVTVQRGLTGPAEIGRVAGALAGAEVLLYSAPSGHPATARAYAEAALAAGIAFVNTTSDPIARDSETLGRFARAGLPLIGDDLASQFGTSIVHHALLDLLRERGLTLVSSYQVNLGGTEDFRNLTENGAAKMRSKLNAAGSGQVAVAPFGYLPHLKSQKVAHLNIEAHAELLPRPRTAQSGERRQIRVPRLPDHHLGRLPSMFHTALAVVDVNEVGGPVSARSSDRPDPEAIVVVEVHL